MDYSDYSSSPDPIVLPSSPPSGHLVRNRLDGQQARRTKSPAKTFIIDTPGDRGKSPWRIRLTVEPQSDSGPDDGESLEQPGQRTRSTHAQQNESPTRDSRRTASVLPDGDNEVLSPRAMRKRKRELQKEQGDDSLLFVAPSASKALRATQLSATNSPVKTKPGNPLLDEEVIGEHTLANEDFTMISGNSLASIKANNSVLGASQRATQPLPAARTEQIPDPFGDPITYPDLQPLKQNNAARTVSVSSPAADEVVPQARDYDAMSWQPTHQTQTVPRLQQQHESRVPVQASHLDDGILDEDIWAEEASRSLEEDAQPLVNDSEGADFVPPIFSDEAQAPRRSKIPKTWRHASGADISYSDSPAQIISVDGRSSSAAPDRAIGKSTTLSSPKRPLNGAQNPRSSRQVEAMNDEFDSSELTNPDAAATQLQNHDGDIPTNRASLQTPRITTRGVNSPSADETGLFWHTDRKTLFSKGPLRPRYPREDLPDLSRILNAQTPASNKNANNTIGTAEPRSLSKHRSTVSSHPSLSYQSRVKSGLREVVSQDNTATNYRQAQATLQSNQGDRERSIASVASRRQPDELLQSTHSKQTTATNNNHHFARVPHPVSNKGDGNRDKPKTYGRKYFGKQHTNCTAAAEAAGKEDGNEQAQDEAEEVEDEDDDDDHSMDGHAEASQSYEEHLNRMSPGKLRVNFQDSISGVSNHDRLRPTRAYPSLFEANAPQRLETSSLSDDEVDAALDKARKTSVQLSPEPEAGLVSRWTSAFWSAFIRARGPIYLDAAAGNANLDMPEFPPTLRARIRARYGVLQEQHPWTMMHMRTLHRMVKSVLTRRSESIIPTELRLPPFLDDIVDTVQKTATGRSFDFTFEHACAIWSFMQILVPLSLVRAMERGEVEWLGDDITKSYRGRIAGRWGAELCFRTVGTPEGLIDWSWLVACLGCVLDAEDMTDE